MENLDGHKSLRIEHKQEKKQQQEFTHIGAGKKRKGLIMFAYNYDTGEIYKVPLTKNEVFDTTKNQVVATYRAIVNPEHNHLYALNKANAKRKFEKLTKNQLR